MASNQKLGLQTSIDAGSLVGRLALIREAEDLGYTSLWVAEVSGPDALVSLAALATNTRQAELATGVVPIQIRTPGAMAMGFLTINELSGGRAAGREPSAVDVGIYIRMCITEEEDKAVDSFRRELAGYAFVDSYNQMFARYGLAAQFDEVRRLWREGKRDEAPRAITEESCRKVAVFG